MASVMNSVRASVLLALCLACSGCALTQGVNNYLEYNDDCNDFVMGWRNEVWARQAWHEQKHYFDGHQEQGAFGAGFRDGYADVASGANGCPPPVPPRKYWTWKYQTPEGQCKVAAWFEGYPHGARAAEEHGAGNFQDIQVSYAIEAQYSPEFQAGGVPHLDEGIQYSDGQPPEPTPYEVSPTGNSAIELIDPQSRVGGPNWKQDFNAAQASFAAQQGPQADLMRYQSVSDPQRLGHNPQSMPPLASQATYSSTQPPRPFGVARLGNGMTPTPNVSRLPQELWPNHQAPPASNQAYP
jgi:hypothetical protein